MIALLDWKGIRSCLWYRQRQARKKCLSFLLQSLFCYGEREKMVHHKDSVTQKNEVEQGENIYRNIYDGTTERFQSFMLLAKWKGSCI